MKKKKKHSQKNSKCTYLKCVSNFCGCLPPQTNQEATQELLEY